MAEKANNFHPSKRDNVWWKNRFYTVLIAVALIGGGCAFFIPPFITSYGSGDSLPILRQTILAATGGVLAILTLWENRRKNDQEHMRQVHAERRSRYATAIEQLADEKAPIRLGGVYTLVKLVDEWLADEKTLPNEEERREEGQAIINSLCAYIRSPFDLASKSEVLSENEAPENYEGGDQQFIKDQARFRQEKELRLTVLDAIKIRLNNGINTQEDGTKKLLKGLWSDFDYNFSNTIFFYSTDFRNSYFNASSSFIQTTFVQRADFREASFTKGADFSGATFTEASFSWAEFTQNADFSGATFTQNANFSGATFTEASFSWAEFTQNADFSGATFTQNANFSGTTFTQNANFSGTTFTQNADFSKAEFAEANFSWAEFTRFASFSGAEFAEASFSRTKFTKASFSRATFTQNADFSKATFTQNANFSGATFTQNADFSKAEFTQNASFSWVKFTRFANFSWVKFTRFANFSGVKFTQNASFSAAIFEDKPKFEYTLDNKTYKARFSCKAAPEDYKFEVSSESPYKIETEEREHNDVKFIIPKGTELFDPDEPSE